MKHLIYICVCLCVQVRWCVSPPTTSWTVSAGLCTGKIKNTPWPTRTCCYEDVSFATLRPATAWSSSQVCAQVYLCGKVCNVVCVTGLIFPVLISGPDTKLMQNSGRTKFKRTSIDRLMNTLVLWVGHPKPLTFMQSYCNYFRTWCQWLESSFKYLL